MSEKSFERQKPFILVTFTKCRAGPCAQWHYHGKWFLLLFTCIRLSIGYDKHMDNGKYVSVECLNLDRVSSSNVHYDWHWPSVLSYHIIYENVKLI